ncbi:lipopolysaccharide biosynthesis protein [Microbacterium sp. A93]|uniref:lipopolysaccharide biosynthesis protein n=1 Tax=Microbacterium sp. A93 TaxID=3450716 RepID=UPI003F426CDF
MNQKSKQEGAAESIRRAIVGRGSVYTIATIAPVVVTLAVTPVLIRTLGLNEYGVVAIAISLFRFGGSLFTLGLPNAVTRSAIVERTRAHGATALVLTGSVVAVVVGGLVATTVPLWAGYFVDGHAASLLLPPVISSVGLAMLLLSQALFRALDRVADYVLFSYASSLLSPILGIVAIWIFGAGAGTYLWALATGHLVTGIGAIVRATIIARPRWVKAEVIRAYRISLPTLPHQLTSSFMTAALVTFAAVAIGQDASGMVQIALLLGTAPMIVLSALNMGWTPMIYRASDAARPRILRDSTRLISAVVLLISAGFVALLPPVADFVAGPEIASAEFLHAAAAAAIGLVFMTMYLGNIHLVFLSGRTALLGITTPLAAVAALVAVFVMVHAFNYRLAAITIGIALFYACICAASFWLRQRSGHPAVLFGPSLPYLVTALIILTIWSFATPPIWLGWGTLALVFLVLGLVEIKLLRRDRAVQLPADTNSNGEWTQ